MRAGYSPSIESTTTAAAAHFRLAARPASSIISGFATWPGALTRKQSCIRPPRRQLSQAAPIRRRRRQPARRKPSVWRRMQRTQREHYPADRAALASLSSRIHLPVSAAAPIWFAATNSGANLFARQLDSAQLNSTRPDSRRFVVVRVATQELENKMAAAAGAAEGQS